MTRIRPFILALLLVLTISLAGQQAASPPSLHAADSMTENIVIGVVNAPPDANGIMAMEPTGINILLNAQGVDDEYFGDPRYFGHQIPAGGRMEIELGGTFERNGVDNDNEFVPFDGNFNLILLAGNPQNVIAGAAGEGVQHGNYTISDDGERTITVTPNGGSGPNGMEGARAAEIGFKTLHFLPRRGSSTGPSPFQNGAAATEGTVAVHIYDADDQLVESGHGSVTFAESLGRQVSPINFGLTSPGNPFLPETEHGELVTASAYQVVAPDTRMVSTTRGETFEESGPYALRFILHEAQELQPDSFIPTLGIPGVGLVIDEEMPWMATLMQDSNSDGILDESDEAIGQVVMQGPSPDSHGRLLQIPDWPLTVSGDGVEDPTRSDLNVPIQVGMEPGYYGVTVSLDGGGQSTIYTAVEEPDATIRISQSIDRFPADMVGGSGNSVVADCQVSDAEYAYQPYDWPDAQAHLFLWQSGSTTTVSVDVSGARANTYYTIWLRLEGTDWTGESFGGSPLTGGGATPLAPVSELGNLLAATGEGNGSTEMVNGFYTDANGNGYFTVELDYPMINGSVPFQMMADFDPADARYPIDNPHAYPVAIVGAEGPFTLRIVSHCLDEEGHGLDPGNREPWFQWSFTDASMTENIVIGVVNAPPDANGIMAMEPTGINILLNAQGVDDEYFGDPRYFGHQIPAGGRMEIELGGTFERNGVDNDNEFVPFDGNFNLILLAGNPQNVIAGAAGEGVQHGNYTISDDGERTITVTPNGGSGPNGMEGARAAEIGFKTLHFLPRRGSSTGPSPFQNGAAATEGTVAVHIYDADDQLVESGHGSVTFAESLGRQVSPINFGLTSPGNPFLPETEHGELVTASAYQVVAPDTRMVSTTRGETFEESGPYALRFILHEAQELQPDSFIPTLGIPGVGLVIDEEMPWMATLMQDSNSDGILDESDEAIGQVVMQGPSSDSHGRLLQVPDWPLTVSGDGVEDPTRSDLNVPIQVGMEPGYYGVTVSLDGGGQSTIYIVVDDEADSM